MSIYFNVVARASPLKREDPPRYCLKSVGNLNLRYHAQQNGDFSN